MAGIYIHIPYCKQACTYCDFHFSTQLKTKTNLLHALQEEIKFWEGKFQHRVSSIYFGGGTPSLLTNREIEELISGIQNHFEVEKEVEITLECNPDDLDVPKLEKLKKAGVNRLSIGVQSFRSEDLKMMNRAHNAEEASNSIRDAINLGFENLSVDLIYGVPGLSDEDWLLNLEKLNAFGCHHLSAYQLTVETKTALAHQIEKGQVEMPEDEIVNGQFKMLMDWAVENNFEHYEISNFAKDKKYSKHNSSYWRGDSYLGLGPAAHSFDKNKRWWNLANNLKYIKAMSEGGDIRSEESIDAKTRYNELIMTGLRTMWGVNRKEVKQLTGIDIFNNELKNLNQWIESGKVIKNNEQLKLSSEGKLLADRIASSLFIL